MINLFSEGIARAVAELPIAVRAAATAETHPLLQAGAWLERAACAYVPRAEKEMNPARADLIAAIKHARNLARYAAATRPNTKTVPQAAERVALLADQNLGWLNMRTKEGSLVFPDYAALGNDIPCDLGEIAWAIQRSYAHS